MTHEVFNQVPPLVDYDLFGRAVGTAEMFDAGRLANEHRPVLHTHGRVGSRIDEVEFHPAYHRFMEAMECLGGNGYAEESMMPDLFRESPVNVIWEGSGNVIVLDTLRAMATAPASVEAFAQELDGARGLDDRVDAAIDPGRHRRDRDRRW